MTPFGRLGVFVLACAALLGVALFTDIHHDPPVSPASTARPVHWGTADEWAALLAANTTTTTAPPEPVTEPVTTTPTPGFRQTPTNHEDESPVVAPWAGLGGASWYGSESGTTTASGEPFDPSGYTFANRIMAFGTVVAFTHGGRTVRATCTDRGPFVGGRDFDLSEATFAAIADPGSGAITVEWVIV